MADQTDECRKLHSAGLYFDMGSDEDEDALVSHREPKRGRRRVAVLPRSRQRPFLP